MTEGPRHRYLFGSFEMDPAERRLTRDGEPVAVLPKVFDVLALLVARAGHLVTKHEIFAAVWPDVEVQESSLTATMSRLRALLEDQGRHGAYVETVTGHGYRFVAPVEVVTAGVEGDEKPAHVRLLSWRAPAMAALAVVAVVAATRLLAGPRSDQSPEARAMAEASYRRGAALLATRRHGEQALEAFREAVRLDPDYAPAHAGMAQVYAMDFAAASLVQASARRAIALDPASADAWSALGFSRAMHEWDWVGAEEAFKRALVADSENAGALQWLAAVRMIQRRFDEADGLLARALRQEVRPGLYADRCQLAYYRRAFLDAAGECARAEQLDPAFPWLREWRLRIALHRGDGPRAWAAISASEYPGWQAVMDTLAAHAADGSGPNSMLMDAEWSALRGERERALDALDRAVQAHAFLAPFANADPTFDALREQPRFRRAMARMGLGAGR